MFSASALVVCRSRITKNPINAATNRTRISKIEELWREMALKARASTGRGSRPHRFAPDLGCSFISLRQGRFHPQFVAFVLGQQVVYSQYLDRRIHFTRTQVANGARHVEHKLLYSGWRRQNLG